MTVALILIVTAVGWAAITGSFTILNLLLGAVIGGAGIYLVREQLGARFSLRRMRRIGGLALLFAYELFASAVKVAFLVIRPDMKTRLKPAIIAFPLTATSDAQITLLANLITLTPGTLSVDVSADRKHLYVHAVDCPDPDAMIASIANGFEKRVMEVFE